jgi:hypothetical protein
MERVAFRNQIAAVPSIQVHSKCFWMASGDTPSFSWEAVVHGSVNNAPFDIATCGNTDPATGQPAMLNGEPVILPGNWQTMFANAGDKAVLQACHDMYFDDNVNGDCRVREHCATEANPCSGTAGPDFPFCVQHCVETPADDTTYYVNLTKADGSTFPDPMTAAPTLYPVADVRRLRRRLTPFRPDPNNPGFVAWQWSVPVVADGTFEDNFSTSLQTMAVRAMLNGRYLSLLRVDVGESLSGSRSRCNADADDVTQITAAQCPTLASLLPSFRNLGTPVAQPAMWQLTLADATDPNNTGLSESSPVMIEFTVLNPTGEQAGPQMAPARVDAGLVPYQGSRRLLSALMVTNDKSQPWMVDNINITGANAAEFSATVHGARTLPGQLLPMGGLSLDITATPSSPGNKQATLQLPMRSADHSQQRTLSAQLVAQGDNQASITVLPDTLHFPSLPQSTQLPIYRNWVIANASTPLPLQITSVSVTGPDAATFTVFELAANGSKGNPLFPITLEGGFSQLFALQFCPARYGQFSATLQITGNTQDSPVTLSASLPVTATAPPAPTLLCAVIGH